MACSTPTVEEQTRSILEVELRTMDGASSVLEVEQRCTVFDLKSQIAEVREIPLECLKLIMGVDILDDTVVLGANGEKLISLALVVSTDELYDQLERSSDLNVLLHSMQVLSKISEVGDKRAIAAIEAQLEHETWQVRVHALEALSKIANPGNDNAITAVLARLEDKTLSVRRQAAQVLSNVAKKGDERAISAVLGKLAHSNTNPVASNSDLTYIGRLLTVRILREISDTGDERVIAAMAALVEDHKEDLDVRTAALRALLLITRKEDRHLIADVLSRLDDEDDIKHVALEVFQKVKEKGVDHVIVGSSSRRPKGAWRKPCRFENHGPNRRASVRFPRALAR